MKVLFVEKVFKSLRYRIRPSRDAADKVVQRSGKFEELVVASHDIAASTAQLVAASRVKSRPKSEKLKGLKSSSRDGVWGERGREERERGGERGRRERVGRM